MDKYLSGQRETEGLWSGITTLFSLKELIWDNVFAEAEKSGRALAHVLIKREMFGNVCVSLAGFSLGAVVIANCMGELEKMGKHDLVYDVMCMGGAVSTKMFDAIGVQPVANKVINFVSDHDFILMILLRTFKLTNKPIGLHGIKVPSRKVQNFDKSDLVNGHNDYKRFMDVILDDADFNDDFFYMFGL